MDGHLQLHFRAAACCNQGKDALHKILVDFSPEFRKSSTAVEGIDLLESYSNT
jgi:hypothetical protein